MGSECPAFLFLKKMIFKMIILIVVFILLFQMTRSRNVSKEMMSYKPTKNRSTFRVLDWTASIKGFSEWCKIYDKNINCRNGINITYSINRLDLPDADLISFHLHHIPSKLPKIKKTQYTLVYSKESEINSPNRQKCRHMDFNMWCNFDRSYPGPLTYFDNITEYLKSLLNPPVPFEEKVDVPVVWISSNCEAVNGRYHFVRELMEHIKIDSFGCCLNTGKYPAATNTHKMNVQIYSKYKFVIAIENSNCEDYVTEKLIQVFESGSVPIVASFDQKPNYLKFAPNNSYINIYNFKTVEELGRFLKQTAANATQYKEFIKFRMPANETHFLHNLDENEILKLARKRMGKHIFFDELLRVEKNENMYCRVAYLLSSMDGASHKRSFHPFPDVNDVCLPRNHIKNYFFNKK